MEKREPDPARMAMIDDVEPIVRTFFDNDGEVSPFFSANAANGEKSMIMTRWGNEEEKVAIIEAVKKLFAEKGVTSYVHVSEVWIKAFAADDVEGIAGHRAPSSYEDKKEAVMLAAADRHGTTVVHYEIDRPMDGSRPTLKARSEPMEEVGGRMTELLPPELKAPFH